MEQLAATIAYGLYLALIVAGGLAAVRCRNLVRALIGLIMTLFGVAGMYFLMAAPFLALMQSLIYVGAVSVLIFFAIMLTRTSGGEAGKDDFADAARTDAAGSASPVSSQCLTRTASPRRVYLPSESSSTMTNGVLEMLTSITRHLPASRM